MLNMMFVYGAGWRAIEQIIVKMVDLAVYHNMGRLWRIQGALNSWLFSAERPCNSGGMKAYAQQTKGLYS